MKKNYVASMNDVADVAKVSQSTVSRVINNHPGISQNTRVSVLQAMRQVGYKSEIVNMLTRGTAADILIDVVMCPLPEQSKPFDLEYYHLMVSGIRQCAQENSVSFDTYTIAAHSDRYSSAVDPDGVILIGYPSPELRAGLRARRINYVIISGDVDSENENIIGSDNFDSGVKGAEYLISKGVTRVGFMMTAYNHVRQAGFIHEFKRHQIEVLGRDIRIIRDTECNSFIEAIHHWILAGDLPQALVIAHLEAARSVETLLRLNRIKVPDDIVLFSFGHRPDLPCAKIPCLMARPCEMGRLGVLRILEQIKNPDECSYKIMVPMITI